MKMEEDIDNLMELLQLQHKYKLCEAYVVEFQQKDPIYATLTHPVLFQRSASLAEQTIATQRQPAGTLTLPPTPPSL